MAKKEKKSGGGAIGAGVIVLALLAILGGGIGIGFGGSGNGDGEGDDNVNDHIEDNLDDNENISDNTTKVYITVSGSDYYYENEKILYNELINVLMEYEEDILVEIKDEDATYNAYSKLTDKLDELYIDYQER